MGCISHVLYAFVQLGPDGSVFVSAHGGLPWPEIADESCSLEMNGLISKLLAMAVQAVDV